MKVGIIRYQESNCEHDVYKYFKNRIFIWHKKTILPNIDVLIIPNDSISDNDIENECKDYGKTILYSGLRTCTH